MCGITIRCTRSRGPRGFFCLHVLRRGPVNVDVIPLGMKFTIRHLLLLTLLVAILIPIGFSVRRYLYPPATPNAIQLLNNLNDWHADELYLYNNPKIAQQTNYMVAGESNAHIEMILEQLDKIEHPAEWNNTTREYEFKFNVLE